MEQKIVMKGLTTYVDVPQLDNLKDLVNKLKTIHVALNVGKKGEKSEDTADKILKKYADKLIDRFVQIFNGFA